MVTSITSVRALHSREPPQRARQLAVRLAADAFVIPTLTPAAEPCQNGPNRRTLRVKSVYPRSVALGGAPWRRRTGAFETAGRQKGRWRILPLAFIGYWISFMDRSTYRRRGADDEQGFGFQRVHLWPRGRHLLPRLSSSRFQRRDPRAGRGASLDRAHHVHVGNFLAACAFVTGPVSFIVVRVLLGVAGLGSSRA